MSTEYDPEYFRSWVYSPRSMYWWSTRYYSAIIRKFCSGSRILEIGCGLGHLLGKLSDAFSTHGIDLSIHALRETRTNAPNSISFVSDMTGLTLFPDEYFDAVVAKHVVEHIKKPPGAFRSIARILKIGGLFLFSTPNTENVMRKMKGDSWHALKDPTHVSLKSPGEWKAIAGTEGFSVVKVFGDGLWDTPYLPYIPGFLQSLLFGAPAALQVLTGRSFIPVRYGESAIFITRKVQLR